MQNNSTQNIPPIPWTTGEILKATGGSLHCGDNQGTFNGISIDSRTIGIDNLFVAIQGRNHDGHRFVRDVVSRGISGVLVENRQADEFSHGWSQPEPVCIGVEDTIRALGDLAAFNRRRTNVSVIAITGSNGKTTTRAMTASVISQAAHVLSTSGNFNNEIGLPLTLLKLDPDHCWAVLELGMNHPGEIKRLTQICAPDVGIITNIAPAHLEGLGSVEGVMRAKGELLQTMAADKKVILNADDHRVMALAAGAPQDIILYGLSNETQIRAEDIVHTIAGSRFTLCLPEERISIGIGIIGNVMVSNALAAAAAGYAIGLTSRQIKSGLETFRPVAGRMNIYRSIRQIHVIDDSYNANPGSMKAAIETLNALRGDGRGVLVAGDMLELGEQAESLHAEIGALAARLKLSGMYLAGTFSQAVQHGAQQQGMPPADIFIGSKKEIAAQLEERLEPGDWVLIKGSRAMGMETIVNDLKERLHLIQTVLP